jgi:uncharacterized protein YjbI with pentapeptide repeats
MPKFEIKSRWYPYATLYNGEGETLAEVLNAAAKSGAVLSGADLRNADLRNAVLRNAVLSGADLRNADLRNADLRNADLSGAVLRNAVLSGAVLSGADLSGAVLRNADLRNAVLSGAVLSGADLSGAVLRNVVLSGAVLRNADLRNADLSGAVLRNAVLKGDFPVHLFRICAEGTIVGYKKLACGNVLQLEIPADAGRMNSLGSRKCRASYAIPIALLNREREQVEPKGDLSSRHNATFKYQIGIPCVPDKYDDNLLEECSSGIHFFITFEEARDY